MPLCRTRSSCSTECRREPERKASMKTASRRSFYRGPTPFRTWALQNLSFLNLHPFLSLSTLQFLVMGRAPCCDKANVKRGPWSPEEDAALRRYIEVHGTGGNWIALPQKAGLKRCGKSCRLRWLNYLRPDIKHGGFTEDEDNIIFTLYKNIGSRWSIIASKLPGRTDNDVKNYWNTKLKKRIMAAGETNIPSAFPTMSKFHHLSWSPASPSTTTSQLSPQPPTVPIPTTKTEAFIDGRPALDFDYSNYPFDSYHLPQLPMPTGIVASPPVDSATSSSISIDNSSGGMSYMNWNCYNRAYNDDAAFMPDLGFGFFSGNQQSPPEEVYQSLIN